jgi:hypothetical protein
VYAAAILRSYCTAFLSAVRANRPLPCISALAIGFALRRPIALDLDLDEVLAHNYPAREIACHLLCKDL